MLDISPSGGEAALIAGGGSILGLGTDIGGSLRIPAHFTGICGFKPTNGRLYEDGRRGAVGADMGSLRYCDMIEEALLGINVNVNVLFSLIAGAPISHKRHKIPS